MFLSVALSQPPPNYVLTRRILLRQNGVEDVSSFHTNTNKYHFHSYSFLIFTYLIKFTLFINTILKLNMNLKVVTTEVKLL